MPTADVEQANVLPEGTSRSRRAPLAPDGGPVVVHLPVSRPSRRRASTVHNLTNPSLPTTPDAAGPNEHESVPTHNASALAEPTSPSVSTTQIRDDRATETLLGVRSPVPTAIPLPSLYNRRIEDVLTDEAQPAPAPRACSITSVHSTDSVPPLASPTNPPEQTPMEINTPISHHTIVPAADTFEPPRLNEQGIVQPSRCYRR